MRHEFSVAQLQNPLQLAGKIQSVGYDHQGDPLLPIKIHQQAGEIPGGGLIQCARRLIGQQKARTINQRPHHRHALAFAPGKLPGPMRHPFREPDPQQQFSPAFFGGGSVGIAPRQGGHQHILEHGTLWQEMMRLKNKTNLPIAQIGQRVVVQIAQIFTVKKNVAMGGAIERADEI